MNISGSQIVIYTRSDGSLTSFWKGNSPFVQVNENVLRRVEKFSKKKNDGTYEIGQWRLRRLCQQFDRYCYYDSVWMMKDGLTARVLARWYSCHHPVLQWLARYESRWNKGFIAGEEFPKTSISYWVGRLFGATLLRSQ